jgi:hypothetical protein
MKENHKLVKRLQKVKQTGLSGFSFPRSSSQTNLKREVIQKMERRRPNQNQHDLSIYKGKTYEKLDTISQ